MVMPPRSRSGPDRADRLGRIALGSFRRRSADAAASVGTDALGGYLGSGEGINPGKAAILGAVGAGGELLGAGAGKLAGAVIRAMARYSQRAG